MQGEASTMVHCGASTVLSIPGRVVFLVALMEATSDPIIALDFAPIATTIGAGVPGRDYPILAHVPDTGFSCAAQQFPGYYADTAAEAGCQAFHICQADGRHDAFLCPNGTVFSQRYLVCDWWYSVDCGASAEHVRGPAILGSDGGASFTSGGSGFASVGDGTILRRPHQVLPPTRRPIPTHNYPQFHLILPPVTTSTAKHHSPLSTTFTQSQRPNHQSLAQDTASHSSQSSHHILPQSSVHQSIPQSTTQSHQSTHHTLPQPPVIHSQHSTHQSIPQSAIQSHQSTHHILPQPPVTHSQQSPHLSIPQSTSQSHQSTHHILPQPPVIHSQHSTHQSIPQSTIQSHQSTHHILPQPPVTHSQQSPHQSIPQSNTQNHQSTHHILPQLPVTHSQQSPHQSIPQSTIQSHQSTHHILPQPPVTHSQQSPHQSIPQSTTQGHQSTHHTLPQSATHSQHSIQSSPRPTFTHSDQSNSHSFAQSTVSQNHHTVQHSSSQSSVTQHSPVQTLFREDIPPSRRLHHPPSQPQRPNHESPRTLTPGRQPDGTGTGTEHDQHSTSTQPHEHSTFITSHQLDKEHLEHSDDSVTGISYSSESENFLTSASVSSEDEHVEYDNVYSATLFPPNIPPLGDVYDAAKGKVIVDVVKGSYNVPSFPPPSISIHKNTEADSTSHQVSKANQIKRNRGQSQAENSYILPRTQDAVAGDEFLTSTSSFVKDAIVPSPQDHKSLYQPTQTHTTSTSHDSPSQPHHVWRPIHDPFATLLDASLVPDASLNLVDSPEQSRETLIVGSELTPEPHKSFKVSHETSPLGSNTVSPLHLSPSKHDGIRDSLKLTSIVHGSFEASDHSLPNSHESFLVINEQFPSGHDAVTPHQFSPSKHDGIRGSPKLTSFVHESFEASDHSLPNSRESFLVIHEPSSAEHDAPVSTPVSFHGSDLSDSGKPSFGIHTTFEASDHSHESFAVIHESSPTVHDDSPSRQPHHRFRSHTVRAPHDFAL